ncbi:hypothetical protein H6503_01910 [Candidatus Woesearchaeota archaeon]|nr:hypothetical protein [Candidatus Woesearchaeota archaeon]
MSIRHDRDLRYRKTRCKTVIRPKTFSTEESAKKYAETNKISKYKLVNLKSSENSKKKIRVVAE